MTPAWQEVIEFGTFRVGSVNRALAVTTCPAGKGVNVARALKTLGGRPFLLGFAGGHTGRLLAVGLRRANVPCHLVPHPQPTRICRTLLDRDTRTATELVEESPLPGRPAWRKFRAAYRRLLRRSCFVVIAGAPMPGAPDKIYARLAREAGSVHVPVIIDARRSSLLSTLPYHPLVAKLNREELASTAGRALRSTTTVIAEARRLIAAGAQYVVVTDGSRGAWLVSADQAWHFSPPRVTALNPVGSGDAMTAGIAFALGQGASPVESVTFGVACGTASAMTLLPADLTRSAVRRAARRISAARAQSPAVRKGQARLS